LAGAGAGLLAVRAEAWVVRAVLGAGADAGRAGSGIGTRSGGAAPGLAPVGTGEGSAPTATGGALATGGSDAGGGGAICSTSTVVAGGGGGSTGAGAGALAQPRVRSSGNDRIQREVLMAARFYRRSCLAASLATQEQMRPRPR
jgi:hypothetical protein